MTAPMQRLRPVLRVLSPLYCRTEPTPPGASWTTWSRRPNPVAQSYVSTSLAHSPDGYPQRQRTTPVVIRLTEGCSLRARSHRVEDQHAVQCLKICLTFSPACLTL